MKRAHLTTSVPPYARPGTRVRYVYTGGHAPAGSLGTVSWWSDKKQAANIRWDDERLGDSFETPDSYDVVRAGRRRERMANPRGAMGSSEKIAIGVGIVGGVLALGYYAAQALGLGIAKAVGSATPTSATPSSP